MLIIKKKYKFIMLLTLMLTAFNLFGNNKLDSLNKKFEPIIKLLETKYAYDNNNFCIIIDPKVQKLYLIKNKKIEKEFIVSTGKKGIGCEEGSFKTPFGAHIIKEKIGENAKIGTIFKARVNTKKIAKIFKNPVDVPEDFVTTRILRLSGLEKGINKGKGVDSYKRYIYIHGTPEEGLLGTEASHGCIRMRNDEVINLFDNVKVGTIVYILKNH